MRISKMRDEGNILIIGCGRLGSSIANTLSNNNKNVTIIDSNKESFRKLSPSFGGLALEGDASDIDVLQEGNIKRTDVIIIATENDNLNIMIAQMADMLFKIKKIIARVYDQEKQCIYENNSIYTISPSLLSSDAINQILEKGEGNDEK